MSVAAEVEIRRRFISPRWATSLVGQRGLMAGLVMLAMLVAAALIGPLIDPDSATSTGYGNLLAPSWSHPFGTDDVGRDVLVRVFYAIRLDLLLALVITVRRDRRRHCRSGSSPASRAASPTSRSCGWST